MKFSCGKSLNILMNHSIYKNINLYEFTHWGQLWCNLYFSSINLYHQILFSPIKKEIFEEHNFITKSISTTPVLCVFCSNRWYLLPLKKKGKKKFTQKRSILEEKIHWKRNSKNSLNIPPRHRVLPPRFYDFMKFQEIEVFTILVINYCSALNDLIIQSPLSSTPHDISINHPLRVKLIPSLLRGTNATANLPPRWRRVITQKRISFFRCRGISGGGGRMGGRARP